MIHVKQPRGVGPDGPPVLPTETVAHHAMGRDRLHCGILIRLRRNGSGVEIARHLVNVRFAPQSGQTADMLACPLCATSGFIHRSMQPTGARPYSISSSALASWG